MLIDIWQSLAEGLPIDEQRNLRRAENRDLDQVEAEPFSAVPDNEDEDRDPYDVVHTHSGPSGDPYADLEDDYEDDW